MRTFAKNNNILQTDDVIIVKALISSGYTEIFEEETPVQPETIEETKVQPRTRKRQRLDAE